MGADQHHDWRSEAASALAWWHEAGVDVLVDDSPRDWFAKPAGKDAVAAPAASAAAMPTGWEAFAAWRASEHAPEHGWGGSIVAASGPIDAPVMILVDCPDRDDLNADPSGGLLVSGGAPGRLFARMLAAIGLDRSAVHLAAVCAKRPVAGRMPRELEEQLGEIARHHLVLAAPKRLLVLGNAASRAILSTDVMQARGRLHPFNHKGGETGVVASFHPRFLVEQPVRKAEAWRDLQLLMGGWDR